LVLCINQIRCIISHGTSGNKIQCSDGEGEGSMKRAVCVGINDYPGQGNDLGGCVNDARAWAAILAEMFGFASADIRLILDREASRRNMLGAIDGLVRATGAGDVSVFVYSGHGTWVPDTGVRDEPEGRDEALVPCEADFSRLILDDDLRPILDNLAEDSLFTFIADSCFSGTVTRIAPGKRLGKRIRFFPPPAALKRTADEWTPLSRRLRGCSEESMEELLMSAASPDEPAAEEEFEGMRRGVFSYFAIETLREAGPEITYEKWVNRIRDSIAAAGFSQTPQLEGPARLKGNTVFAPITSRG
jgi:hypothetical protein